MENAARKTLNLNALPRVLLLDIGGVPKNWISYEKAAYYATKGLIAYEPEEAHYTLRGGINSITESRSRLDIKTIIAINNSNSASKRVPFPTAQTLFRRDHNRCCYCGNVFTRAHLEMEHIIPVSKGGKNTWDNMVTSCGGCNDYKADNTPAEAGMHMYYQPYIPNRAEYLVLANSSLTDEQLVYLQNFIKDEKSRWKDGFDRADWLSR